MRVLKVLAFLASALLMVNSYADSDGVYCTGKDYVAIDARGIYLDAKGPTTSIITITSAGDLEKFEFSTPPNQNKSLSCQPRKILSSDGNIIDLSDIEAPSIKKGDVDSKTKFSSSQLPYIQSSQSIKIDTTDKSHVYSLVLDHNIQIVEQGMHLHFVSARVVKVTKFGSFVSSKSLSEGVRLETVH
jgi:hypothetical protein